MQLSLAPGYPDGLVQAKDEARFIKEGSGIRVTLLVVGVGPNLPQSCFTRLFEICDEGGWSYGPDYYPSGEVLFLPGSPYNLGGYDSAEMDGLIDETTTSGDLSLTATSPTYHTSFASWTATDAPFLWQPMPA